MGKRKGKKCSVGNNRRKIRRLEEKRNRSKDTTINIHLPLVSYLFFNYLSHFALRTYFRLHKQTLLFFSSFLPVLHDNRDIILIVTLILFLKVVIRDVILEL